jgi:hypothetical protein
MLCSYVALRLIGGHQIQYQEIHGLVIIITLLITMVASLSSRYYFQSEIHNGFAILKNGEACLPSEISLGMILGKQIKRWVSYEQPLNTNLCVVINKKMQAYFDVTIQRELTQDSYGKKIAAHLNDALEILEKNVQKAIYQSSEVDPSMGELLRANRLLNEEDIDIIKSKILSTIEMNEVQGISYSHVIDTIQFDIFSIQREEVFSNQSSGDLDDDDDDLSLDIDILHKMDDKS